MTKKAAIYTRISRDREGRELGVARQREDCRALAERLGYDDVEVFEDNDVSASTLSDKPRPDFLRMMTLARKGEFDAIIAYSNSRLTRRVAEIQAIIDVTKKTGIRVHTVASGQHNLDTADGRASMLTIAVWDQAEAERTAERIKRQKRQSAEEGRRSGGAIPYGYRDKHGGVRAPDTVLPNGQVVKGRLISKVELVPDPDEAEVVREAVRRVLAGDSLHAIVTDWNKRRVVTRNGKHWRQTNLRHILMNVSLLGKTKAGAKGWEPIIDQADFDRLQRILTDPTRKVTHSPGVKSGKYSMGGGLTVCAECGKRLITHVKRGRPALACLKRVNGPEACGSVVVDHQRLERHVFETVVASLQSDDEWARALAERDPETEARIAELESKRAALLEEQRRVNDMYRESLVDLEYVREHVTRIKDEFEASLAEIVELRGRPILAEAKADGLNWRDWGADRRRNFLRALGVRVEVSKWPAGMPKNMPIRRGESRDDWEARREAFQMQVVAERTRIVPLQSGT